MRCLELSMCWLSYHSCHPSVDLRPVTCCHDLPQLARHGSGAKWGPPLRTFQLRTLMNRVLPSPSASPVAGYMLSPVHGDEVHGDGPVGLLAGVGLLLAAHEPRPARHDSRESFRPATVCLTNLRSPVFTLGVPAEGESRLTRPGPGLAWPSRLPARAGLREAGPPHRRPPAAAGGLQNTARWRLPEQQLYFLKDLVLSGARPETSRY